MVNRKETQFGIKVCEINTATITDVIKDKIYHNNKSSHTICQNDNWFHALNRERRYITCITKS
jgi:hypothetical protein